MPRGAIDPLRLRVGGVLQSFSLLLDRVVLILIDPAYAPPSPPLATVIEDVVSPVPFLERGLPQLALLEPRLLRGCIEQSGKQIGRRLVVLAMPGQVSAQIAHPAHGEFFLREVEDGMVEDEGARALVG